MIDFIFPLLVASTHSLASFALLFAKQAKSIEGVPLRILVCQRQNCNMQQQQDDDDADQPSPLEVASSALTSTQSVECWENQRYVLFKGWGPFRLPTDRPLWSNRKGDRRQHLESFLIPLGFVWHGEWEPEYPPGHGAGAEETSPSPARSSGSSVSSTPSAVAEFGWLYAPDFTVPSKYCSRKPSPISIVRRRRWTRTLKRLTEPVVESGSCGGEMSPNGRSASPLHVYADHECFSQPEYWARSLWYGFLGGSRESALDEQQRNHESFHRLVRFSKGMMNAAQLCPGQACSVPLATTTEEPDDPASASAVASIPSKVPSKYLSYVYKYGIAGCLRCDLWVLWSGVDVAATCQAFPSLSAIAAQTREGPEYQEIVQDVVRTAPRHPFFDGKGSVGSIRLTNLLLTLSLSEAYPGYHQAFSYIAALFLLNCSAEVSYALLLHVFQVLLPPDYHEKYLLQHDIRIFSEMLRMFYPHLDDAFQRRQIDVSVFASGWLQGLFCAHFPFAAAARIFDVMFAEGNSSALIRFMLAFVKVNERVLVDMDSSCTLGQFANDWARQQFDVQPLMNIIGQDKLGPWIAKRRGELYSSPR